jgi:hypothetical protein
MILEAINSVDPQKVRIVDLSWETHLGTTSIGMPIPIHSRLKTLAKSKHIHECARKYCRAHWLAGKNIIRLA